MEGRIVFLLLLVLLFPFALVQAEENAGVVVSDTLLGFYQRHLTIHDGARCLFFPTCSEFFRQAAERYGWFWGAIMTLERMLYREHRWSLSRYPPTGDGVRRVDPVYHNYIFDAEAYYR